MFKTPIHRVQLQERRPARSAHQPLPRRWPWAWPPRKRSTPSPSTPSRSTTVLKKILLGANIRLIDFKLEFGRLSDGTIVLADEISPDTCRFWDATTGAHLDKDLFRRNLGGEADAYQEVMKRLLG